MLRSPTGIWVSLTQIQHADTGTWVPFLSMIGADGTVLAAQDNVSVGRPLSNFPAGGTTNGSFFWPIPWRTQVRGGGMHGAIVFDTLNHHATYTASSRELRMSKGNRSAQRTVP